MNGQRDCMHNHSMQATSMMDYVEDFEGIISNRASFMKSMQTTMQLSDRNDKVNSEVS